MKKHFASEYLNLRKSKTNLNSAHFCAWLHQRLCVATLRRLGKVLSGQIFCLRLFDGVGHLLGGRRLHQSLRLMLRVFRRRFDRVQNSAPRSVR